MAKEEKTIKEEKPVTKESATKVTPGEVPRPAPAVRTLRTGRPVNPDGPGGRKHGVGTQRGQRQLIASRPGSPAGRGGFVQVGAYARLRSQIAAKAAELLSTDKKRVDTTPSFEVLTQLADEAFPDYVLGQHLLEWVKDHKGKAADPAALLDQAAKVLVFLASV